MSCRRSRRRRGRLRRRSERAPAAPAWRRAAPSNQDLVRGRRHSRPRADRERGQPPAPRTCRRVTMRSASSPRSIATIARAGSVGPHRKRSIAAAVLRPRVDRDVRLRRAARRRSRRPADRRRRSGGNGGTARGRRRRRRRPTAAAREPPHPPAARPPRRTRRPASARRWPRTAPRRRASRRLGRSTAGRGRSLVPAATRAEAARDQEKDRRGPPKPPWPRRFLPSVVQR